MCFKKKNNIKHITSRYYYLMSGRRYFNIRSKKEDRILTLVFVNNGGSATFLLNDKEKGEITRLLNPSSDTYHFEIEKDRSYSIEMTFSSCKGSYKLFIEKKDVS